MFHLLLGWIKSRCIIYITFFGFDNITKIILDLFCGTGTIGQLISKNTPNNIIGVDIVESAIKNAKKNAKKNQLQNLKFISSDVGKFLINHPEYQNKIHSIVTKHNKVGA